MSLLVTERISKTFGGVVALMHLNFTIEEGCIFGVIGPNGAGKTTLISLIAGYEKVSEGKIHFQGNDITNLPAFRRARLGIVRTFQIPQVFANLTVRENIMIPLLLRHSGKDANEKAEAIAERMLLRDDIGREAQMLPVGKLKLLEIAKAYAASPKLLLVDEPMGGVSTDRMDSLISIIRGLRDEGITIILVEHVMKAVVSLADELLVLNFGQMLACGKPKKIMAEREVIEAYLGEEHA